MTVLSLNDKERKISQNLSRKIIKILTIEFIVLFLIFFVMNNYIFSDNNMSIYIVYFVVFIFFLLFLNYMFLKKIQKEFSRLCYAVQKFLEENKKIIFEFDYPRKNIEKSFKHQFDSVNQTAAATTQITSMIYRTIEQINESKEIIQNVEIKLKDGKEAMSKLDSSIDVIKCALEDMDQTLHIINQINSKSSVISDIVAKTELLAMNASIEAARAGELGKGFSVVSEEVSNLARTSGQSAKRIKDLLSESSLKVGQIVRTMSERIKEGEAVSIDAIDAFDRIEGGVKSLKEQIRLISETSLLQKEVINKISQLHESFLSNANKSVETIRSDEKVFGTLKEINHQFFDLIEEFELSISGLDAMDVLKSNQESEVKRFLYLI